MEDFITKLFSENLPALLTSIITGVVILTIEYRTGWFASRVRGKSEYSRTPFSRRARVFGGGIDWTELPLKIVLFIMLFLLVFMMVGFTLSLIQGNKTSTILDNSSDPNVVVKTIGENDSIAFFDNSLFISVDDISYEAVGFTVGAPGYLTQVVENARNGTSLTYVADDSRYEIRVTSIRRSGLFEIGGRIDFAVIRLQE